jgi:hypothetical protein
MRTRLPETIFQSQLRRPADLLDKVGAFLKLGLINAPQAKLPRQKKFRKSKKSHCGYPTQQGAGKPSHRDTCYQSKPEQQAAVCGDENYEAHRDSNAPINNMLAQNVRVPTISLIKAQIEGIHH